MELFDFIFDKKFLLTEKQIEPQKSFRFTTFLGLERYIYENPAIQEFVNEIKGEPDGILFISKNIVFTYKRELLSKGMIYMYIKSKKNNDWTVTSVIVPIIADKLSIYSLHANDDLLLKYAKVSAKTSILELYEKMFRISDIHNDVHIRESVFKSSMCTSLISRDCLINLEKRLKNSRETYIKIETKKSYLFFAIKIPNLVVNFLFKTILRKNKKSLISYLNNEFKLIRNNRIKKIEIKNYGI